MPRNVRNFWLELSVDGRKTSVATGPRSREGGFRLTIYMRDRGDILKAATIDGWRRTDGDLCLDVTGFPPDGQRGFNLTTKR